MIWHLWDYGVICCANLTDLNANSSDISNSNTQTNYFYLTPYRTGPFALVKSHFHGSFWTSGSAKGLRFSLYFVPHIPWRIGCWLVHCYNRIAWYDPIISFTHCYCSSVLPRTIAFIHSVFPKTFSITDLWFDFGISYLLQCFPSTLTYPSSNEVCE